MTARNGQPRGKKGAPSPRETPQSRFLRALSEGLHVCEAVRRAGVSRSTVYNWKNEDPAFAEAWDDAKEEYVDRLEVEATRRALAGSDTLLIFLLKSHRPDVYSERVRQTIEQKAEVTTVNEDAIRQNAQGEAIRTVWQMVEEALKDEGDLLQIVIERFEKFLPALPQAAA